jgi:hypothetical protein
MGLGGLMVSSVREYFEGFVPPHFRKKGVRLPPIKVSTSPHGIMMMMIDGDDDDLCDDDGGELHDDEDDDDDGEGGYGGDEDDGDGVWAVELTPPVFLSPVVRARCRSWRRRSPCRTSPGPAPTSRPTHRSVSTSTSGGERAMYDCG